LRFYLFDSLGGGMPTFNDKVVTDSLIQYIQAIQHDRRTGVLLVRRGNRNVQEEGTIHFVQGHIVETKLNRHIGSAAFNELCSWGNCQVSFFSNYQQERKDPVTPTPPSLLSQNPTPPPGQIGLYQANSSPLEILSSPSYPSYPSYPRVAQTGEQGVLPSTDVLRAKPSQTHQFSAALQMLDNLQLSRAHRQIFLLINSLRTVEELIYLSARKQEEVLQILSDLEQVALIHV
jgi:hypothetical protein